MDASSKNYLDRLFTYESPDATFHPHSYPVVLKSAAGSLVKDIEGRTYIDLCAGFGSLALGHKHKRIEAAIQQSLASGLIQGYGDVYATAPKIAAIEELHRVLPSQLSRSNFAVTGSQAVEYAIKTAMVATKRHTIVVVEGSYHGLDFGALSVTSNSFFREGFEPWLQKDQVIWVPYSDDQQVFCKHLRKVYETYGNSIAAVLMEPIQGRAGTREFSVSCLQEVAEIAHQSKSLLILDEVLVGLGRLGQWTYAEQVNADIVCLGKALGAGMPISSTVAKKEVMESWQECKGEARHTGTFFGHPLSCAVSAAALKAIREEELCARALEIGKQAREYLEKELKGCSRFIQVRGRGLMLVLALKEPLDGVKLMHEALQHGVLAIPSGPAGDALSITPALNIPETELMQALEILVRLIKS